MVSSWRESLAKTTLTPRKLVASDRIVSVPRPLPYQNALPGAFSQKLELN